MYLFTGRHQKMLQDKRLDIYKWWSLADDPAANPTGAGRVAAGPVCTNKILWNIYVRIFGISHTNDSIT